ncbi:endo-1,4-beta-xylanase [Fibrobacter sp. UWH4]|uniref:endo-1,4-beta-xylanase n=1 Tax=Fibrobacter sp. UWH4 TaxID=1896210 RepID=UPI0009115454|nr:endo-1,4-beta-xylanase [Fibrobacter sp. UWH4]SHL53421.1 Endo-1,4-beta-xylanase, GH35 family [Fibrobacter sp. UWH4]
MKKIISTATKVAAVAFAMSTFSFAGPGLADGAAKFVGNITTHTQVRSDFTQLWNQITAENECKWASIEGSRGKFNWGGCDAAYNWAKNNGGHFKFHALVWGSQYPSWLNGLSADETKKAITNWMDAVKQHYPDLEMIDVVNEAIKTSDGKYHSNYGPQGNNNIIAALGGDKGNYEFVAEAFRMARERWPDAILIYNDYNTVQWQKNEGIDLIQKLKKAGAPVDAYGLQAHDMMSQGGGQGGTGGGGSCLSLSTLKSTIEDIWNKTQIPLFISEYDIFTNDANVQKKCYSEQISYFMENENIAGITIWGYIYGATWNDGTSGIIKDGKDRPAMTWLKEYLASNKGVNTTGLPTGELTPVEPEPQTPFKGKAFDLSGKIEAEDFDIPGKGKGNNSYSVSGDCDDTWNTEYRKGTSVKIGEKNGGLVLGCNPTGNYFQYTINAAAGGTFKLKAAVAADGDGALVFKVGDKVVSDTLKYTGSSWTSFDEVSGSITLEKGDQILTMEVAKGYIDVDWFQIDAGKVPIAQTVKYVNNTRQDYHVFDQNGVHMGVLTAYGFDAAKEILQNSSAVKASGIYYLRSRTTGQMQSVRVTR